MQDPVRRIPRLLFWALVAALLLLAPTFWLLAAPEAPAIQGRWLLDFEKDGSVQLTLERRSPGHHGSSSDTHDT